MSGCLNEYQLEFLKLFVDRGCRFLIVRGQARAMHQGTRTRDLDIWVDISQTNKPTAEQCISAWIARYPVHAILQTPVLLQAGQQIKFPEPTRCSSALTDGRQRSCRRMA